MRPLFFQLKVLLVLAFVLATASCSKLENQFSQSIYDCGEPSGFIKVLSLEGETGELRVKASTDRGYEEVSLNAKACFAHDPQKSYFISERSGLSAIVPVAYTSASVILERRPKEEPEFRCPSQAVYSSADLGSIVPDIPLALDVKVDGQRIANVNTLGLRTWFAELVLTEGAHRLEIEGSSLRDSFRVIKQSCDIIIDSTVPTVSLRRLDGLSDEAEGAWLIDPSDRLALEVNDKSGAKVLSCFAPMEKADSCRLVDQGSVLATPASGDYRLYFQAVDSSGLTSPLMSQRIMSFHRRDRETFFALSRSSALARKAGEIWSALLDILKAGKIWDRLILPFERNDLRREWKEGLLQTLVREGPYHSAKQSFEKFAMSPDERSLLLVDREQVQLLDVQSGRMVWQFSLSFVPGLIRWCPDSRCFVMNDQLSGETYVYEPKNGSRLRTLERSARNQNSRAAFDMFFTEGSGLLAVAGLDDRILVYEINSGRIVWQWDAPEILLAFQWASGKDELWFTQGKKVYRVDMKGQVLDSIELPKSLYVSAIAELSDGSLLMNSIDEVNPSDRKQFNSSLYSYSSSRSLVERESYKGNFDKILPSPDRQSFVLFGVGSGGALLGFQWQDDSKLQRMDGAGDLRHIEWSGDSQWLALTIEDENDKYAELWSAFGTKLRRFPGRSLGLSLGTSGQRMALMLEGQKLELWTLSASLLRGVWDEGSIQGIHFSPSGRFFLTVADLGKGYVRYTVRDYQTLEIKKTWVDALAFAGLARSAQFMSENEVIFARANTELRKIRIDTGAQESIFNLSEGVMTSFAASRNRVAVGTSLGEVKLLEGAELKSLGQVHQAQVNLLNEDIFPAAVMDLCFAEEGLVSGGMDGGLALNGKAVLNLPNAILRISCNHNVIGIAARLRQWVEFDLSRGDYQISQERGGSVIDIVQVDQHSLVLSADRVLHWQDQEGDILELKLDGSIYHPIAMHSTNPEWVYADKNRLHFVPKAAREMQTQACQSLSELSRAAICQ